MFRKNLDKKDNLIPDHQTKTRWSSLSTQPRPGTPSRSRDPACSRSSDSYAAVDLHQAVFNFYRNSSLLKFTLLVNQNIVFKGCRFKSKLIIESNN